MSMTKRLLEEENEFSFPDDIDWNYLPEEDSLLKKMEKELAMVQDSDIPSLVASMYL